MNVIGTFWQASFTYECLKMIATSIVITGHNVTGMSFMAFHFMLDLLSCINDKDK